MLELGLELRVRVRVRVRFALGSRNLETSVRRSKDSETADDVVRWRTSRAVTRMLPIGSATWL